jgi:hypothetical protein
MGLEYIVQPQVFLGGLTALGPGIQGLTENYPLLTTYYSWTSTAVVDTAVFPIPIQVGSIYDGPGKEASFIISVGGVIQSPTEYTVDTILRTITFGSVVSAGIEFAATQLATASPSSQNFNFLKSVSAEFTSTAFINNLSATTGTINSLLVTNLTALSTTVNVIDIKVSEVSGFNITGNLDVQGITTTQNLVATNATVTNLTASTGNLNVELLDTNNAIIVSETVTNSVITNLTATNITDVATAIITDLTATNVRVQNNILASGNIVGNNLPTYFVLSADLSVKQITAAPTPFFDSNVISNLLGNKKYKLNYDLYYLSNNTGNYRFILSASNVLSGINCSYITTNTAGISGASLTPQMGATFAFNSVSASLAPFGVTSSVFQNTQLQAILETANPCTFNLTISGTGNSSILPKRGSSRIIQLME